MKTEKTKPVIDSTRQRAIAEDMYIRNGMTGREIAEICGVTEQTISRWKRGKEGEKNWDERKNELQLTPVKVKEILLEEAMKVASGEKSGIDADKLSKIVAAIDRLDKKINVRLIMDVFREFDNYVVEIDPKIAVEFTKYHKLFLQYRISIES
ncbi:MAG: DUF1804 family protein [Prevotellaceae bacterium]|jgi:transposase|nr:DUF1804 family protein [Prevotellaceae bacterium]